jgi:hypothetical protein
MVAVSEFDIRLLKADPTGAGAGAVTPAAKALCAAKGEERAWSTLNAPEHLDAGDDEPGTTDDHVERFEGLLLASWEPCDASIRVPGRS